MGLTSEQRAGLQRFVAKARKLVADDFMVQMQSVYGLSETTIQPLEALPALSQAELTVARILRERLSHIRSGTPDSRDRDAIAFARLARELSFGLVNRFVAVRMAEKRQLIEETLASHYESTGFLNFKDAASSLGSVVFAYASTYEAYRQFLYCLFDELATDLGEVMASGATSALLFPTEAKLTELIALMNDGAIDPLWSEDETIGWIYQYYNDPDERKLMRDESLVPRTSRELAVRNQFFTPRYVVEFLTDNTLGRLWCEMTEGATSLVGRCRHLVRRPQERSTAAQIPPELPSAERLQLPEEVPHRPLKDPRTMRFLDPACGSMHFGLYAFELFEVIYAEAWERNVGTLRADFPELAAFRREVPRLILENNIYGVDIDPRAVQIARLALWLRAQKAWQQLRVAAVDRPQIRKSHVVCAEPMPGNRQLLDEFIATHLAGTPENEILAKLLRRIVESMELAGEAGVLLRIEGAIADAVRQEKGRDQAVVQKALPGLGADRPVPSQEALPGFSLGGVADENFWAGAEARLYAELARYSGRLEQGGLQRKMFAEDASQGFAFIDLCRERFDVIVMNPPFGEASSKCQLLFSSAYPNWANNILSCFLIRSLELLNKSGYCGAIFDRTALIKSSYEELRREVLIGRILTLADTGWEVLDANVETTSVAYSNSETGMGGFVDLRRFSAAEKPRELLAKINMHPGRPLEEICWVSSSEFKNLPNAVIGYDFDSFALRCFGDVGRLDQSGFQARQGHALVSDFHFRNFWEFTPKELLSSRHRWVYNGSDFSLFVAPFRMVVLDGANIERFGVHRSVRLCNEGHQLKAGIGYGKRGEILDAHILNSGLLFTAEGQAIHGSSPKYGVLTLLGFLNSRISQYLINLYCGQHKHAGYVNLLPDIAYSVENIDANENLVASIVARKNRWLAQDETSATYIGPAVLVSADTGDLGHRVLTVIKVYSESQAEHDKALIENNEVFVNAARLSPQDRISLSNWWDHFGCIDSVWPCLKREGIETLTPEWLAADLISYFFGAVFCRWSLCIVEYKSEDIFSKLPALQPALLEAGRDALEPFYFHSDDVLRHLGKACEVMLGEGSQGFDVTAARLLNVESVGQWLDDVNGFFAFHLKRYTKSHRAAPIYWPLSSRSGKFVIWVYYPRLDSQSLPKLIADVISPKIRALTQEIENRRAAPGGKIADLEAYRIELEEMRADFTELIKLGYQPHQRDGVLITACPLAKYFRHTGFRRELEDYWEDLSRGSYDWSRLAICMWPERVHKACMQDRSIAIAHGREDLCSADLPKASRGRKKTPPTA